MLLNCGVGEDSWESLGLQEVQPVHPKGDQSWIFIGRTDAEAETPILWPPDVKNWLIGKDPDAGKDWRQEEKGMTEDEMVGWHYWLNGLCESEQALGGGDGQGSLACCSPWGLKDSDMAEWLKWAERKEYVGDQISFLPLCVHTLSHLTLCDPVDCSPPGSFVHRISQARILEWISMPSSRGSSWPRDQTFVACIAGRFFTTSATWEAHSQY